MTLAKLVEHFELHPDHAVETQLQEAAAEVFGPGGGNRPSEPEVDVKPLHAKIVELRLESSFLEGALRKAGLLGAKR
ncbi:transposase [Bradyrhizobium nanningense]|nr:transposase [Bradyrhizobium nanningense]